MTETATDPLPTPAPRIRGLLIAQFFGAFNDNAFKMLLVLLAIAAAGEQGESAKQTATTLATAVFTLPLMLFCLPAMALGDRVGKRSLVVWTKFAEVLLMLAGTVALWLAPDGWLPLVVLAGMGAQSALFAPAKYGILPEILPHEQLSGANGRLEAASFLAIILGTVAGGLLLDACGARVWLAGALLTALAVAPQTLLGAQGLANAGSARVLQAFVALVLWLSLMGLGAAAWSTGSFDRMLRSRAAQAACIGGVVTAAVWLGARVAVPVAMNF